MIGKDVFSDLWICSMKMTCSYSFVSACYFNMAENLCSIRAKPVDESAIAMDAQQCICFIATVFFLDQIKRFRFIPYIGFVTFDLFILIRLRVVFFFTEITMNNVGHGSQFIDTMWQVRFVRISINKWYVIIIIKKNIWGEKHAHGLFTNWIKICFFLKDGKYKWTKP